MRGRGLRSWATLFWSDAIVQANNGLARQEELADPKYNDAGGIFDIMAMTVIHTHFAVGAP